MVELGQPQWRLRKQRCPCYCGGEGFLVFITCPACGQVVLFCDEVGTIFPNPHDLNEGPLATNYEVEYKYCPNCSREPIERFSNSSSDEIRALGFGTEEFE